MNKLIAIGILSGLFFLVMCGLVIDRGVQIQQNSKRISAIENFKIGTTSDGVVITLIEEINVQTK